MSTPTFPQCTSHLAGRRDQVALHDFFLLILGQKTFYFPATMVRPQGSVYQEMRSAINKYRKTILPVVRIAATVMIVRVCLEVPGWRTERKAKRRQVKREERLQQIIKRFLEGSDQ